MRTLLKGPGFNSGIADLACARHHITYLEYTDIATAILSAVALVFLLNAKKLKKAPAECRFRFVGF